MAIQQPASDGLLSAFDHARMHRVLAVDEAATEQSISVAANADVTLLGALVLGAKSLTINSVEIVGSDGQVNKAAVESSSNWDTAYGWGNHASGGYLTSEDNDLETDGAVGIADTEIFIGTGAGVGNYAALSGDITMSNAGVTAIGANKVTATMLEDDLTFQTFPLTPSSAPDADYEVANKKYVDDNSGGGTPDDASVSQAKLKTTTGSVDTNSGNYVLLTLPGGEYGFYPQFKCSYSSTMCNAVFINNVAIDTSYNARVSMNVADSKIIYAQQRYITSSGKDHWIFLLIDKTTGKIVSAYEAPDHPSYGNGGDETKLIHPFGSMGGNQEVVLVDNKIITELKPLITRQNTLLTLINEKCLIDDTKRPKYEPREIIEIDEFGDLRGEVIASGRTPDWAKIKIMRDEYELKRRMVETLPEQILYKELRII